MFRRNYLTVFLTITLLLIGGISIFAQNAPVRGKVELTKADGTKEGVVGALVEVYRIDVKASSSPAKSDKKGFFSFAGLPLGAQFALVISAPGIKPLIQGGIKAGMESVLIPVEPGDGKKYTEEEVRAALATSGGGGQTQTTELTAEQKKKKAEYDKQVAEVTGKNEKIKKATDVVNASLKEGGAAYEAKNYDLAITKFDEGFNADPTFEGTAPVMLNNKSLALMSRATETYNKSVKADEASRPALREAAKKDFAEVVIASDKALELLKTAPAATEPAVQKGYEANKFLALTNRKNAYRLMSQTGVDREKGKVALVAFQEYMAVETDPAKKAKAQLDLASTLQDSNEFELAIIEFQKILETDPNNVDALVGIGLSMVNVGYINLDTDAVKGKAQLQEAANYLQKFVDIAPDTHKFKKDAADTIASLKEQQKVAPQKIKSTPGKTVPKKKN